MQKITSVLVILCLAGCAPATPKHGTSDLIDAQLTKAVQTNRKAAQPDAAVEAALLPPIRIEVPKAQQPAEERFGVTFNNVPAAQFFMGLVSGTRYSMLVHPDVTGTISVNLKDVTLFEALDAVRELYGYDYTVDGNRIYVKPLSLQTRVFQVNYLTGSRKGTSDVRVTSGSVSDSSTSGNTSNNNINNSQFNPGLNQTNNTQTLNSSKIRTTSDTDFWAELKSSLTAIVGNKEGRSVVVSPQSGVVVVRAMWDEMRNIAAYLKATQLSVDRQVILEAKILEVQLNDSEQAGVNWSAFHLGKNHGISGGMISPTSTLTPFGSATQLATPLPNRPGSLIQTDDNANTAGTLFGLAFQTSNFAALLSFLETQGSVHVLSSPRIATLNNQKAVLKVGTDQFFVTNVSTTTTATGGGATQTSPSVTVQPFFSGVALDVTPQIDDSGNVILHIHPSVSNVTTVPQTVKLGDAGGNLILPLASSTISETDSIVRGRNGQIFALGGLMRQATTSDRSQLPGAGDLPVVGALFRNTNQVMQKRELVILLKPTVVEGSEDWNQDILESQRRIQGMNSPRTVSER